MSSQIPEDPAMQIAIIGAGNVGRALASSLTRAGHDVTVSAEHPEHATEAATRTGARAVSSNAEAVRAADLVVLAVPATALDKVATELGQALAGQVVVHVDAGSLAAARTLEGMAWLNIQRNMAGGSWQDAWVLVGPDTIESTGADRRN